MPTPQTSISVDEILLPPTRHGLTHARGITWSLVRELDLDDLPLLMDSGALTPAVALRPLAQARSAHHLLAQLAAEGKSNIEIGLITGYTPEYVSGLRRDPTFRELLAHYMTEREKVFVDALERMKLLGVNSLEELQSRLIEDPGKFRNSELLAIADLMLVKGAKMGGAGSGSNAPSVGITVNFIPSSGGVTPPTLDITPNGER